MLKPMRHGKLARVKTSPSGRKAKTGPSVVVEIMASHAKMGFSRQRPTSRCGTTGDVLVRSHNKSREYKITTRSAKS